MAKVGAHTYNSDTWVCLYHHADDGTMTTFNFKNNVDNDDIATAILMLRERERQEAKFPGQRLASVDPRRPFGPKSLSPDECACMNAGVLHETECKQWIADTIADGRLPTWADVLVEEVSEAICALARGDTEHGIEELTQVAAVAVRWIGALRRGETL